MRVDPPRVGRWRFVTLRHAVDTSRDIADLDINLDLMPDKERTVVRLALTGSLTVTDKAALDACLDKYARLFAALALVGTASPRSRSSPPTASSTISVSAGSPPPLSTNWWPRRAPTASDADDATGRRMSLLLRLGRQGPRRRMRLHRLVLTNYRGITHREIEFPDHGVVVVCGANEIGKSSMIEALDLLLESKDRSTKKEVKQVKPTHADVGAEITAEISTGPYRFVYRKRFHKRAETALTVLAPRREQLTGDEAHDRVRAILDETVDVALWQAQRVLQSASTAAVDLSGCDALSRALDVAAGEAVQLSGAEPLLIDRIDAEYLRYFTPTGRPTGEWADRDQANARRRRRGGPVRGRGRRGRRRRPHAHATLTAELERLSGERAEAAKRLATARSRRRRGGRADPTAQAGGGGRGRRRCHAGGVRLGADRAAQAAGRRRRADRGGRRTGEGRRAGARGRAHRPRGAGGGGGGRRRGARSGADAVRMRVRRPVAPSSSSPTAMRRRRLSGRLAKIDAAHAELERVERELAPIALTDAPMRDIETAAAAVERAAGQAELASAHIELVAAADIELRVGGESVVLQAGAAWSASATRTTEIDVPGVLTARVVPGEPASDTQAELDAAQQVLAGALAAGRVDDVAARASSISAAGNCSASRDRSTATVSGLLGGDDVDALRARLAELRRCRFGRHRRRRARPIRRRARTELDDAAAAHQQAIAECETHRKVAEAAAKRLGEQATQASVAQEKLTACFAELTVGRERLAQQRATTTDDDLHVKAEADMEKARRATGLVADLGGELARCAPDTVAAALDEALRRVDALSDRHDEVADALRLVTAQLKVYGTEGRKGELDAAETEREHAEAEYLRVHRRAQAAAVAPLGDGPAP